MYVLFDPCISLSVGMQQSCGHGKGQWSTTLYWAHHKGLFVQRQTITVSLIKTTIVLCGGILVQGGGYSNAKLQAQRIRSISRIRGRGSEDRCKQQSSSGLIHCVLFCQHYKEELRRHREKVLGEASSSSGDKKKVRLQSLDSLPRPLLVDENDISQPL